MLRTMLDGQATILISYSGAHEAQAAKPVAEGLSRDTGVRVVLVGEEPLPPDIASTPQNKVDWYFRHADMVVYLATPDDRLESGEVRTRQNIIDEHRLGQSLPHLEHRLMVFKSSEVTLPSNINPVYERLPLDDVPWLVDKIVEQARVWGVLPRSADVAVPAPTASGATARNDILLSESPDAIAQGQNALRSSGESLEGAAHDQPAIWRAQLALAGLMMSSSSDFLGVGLVVSLFGQRERLVLTDAERRSLLRTALRRRGEENTPLCWTLAGLDRTAALGLLIDFAASDRDVEVRRRAIEILSSIPSISSMKLVEAVARAASEDWAPLRRAAHGLARQHGSRNLIDAATSTDAAAADPLMVRATRLLTQVAVKPGPVLTEYVSSFEVERLDSLEAAILGNAARVGWTHVHAALGHESSSVRQLAARLAAAKGGLQRDYALARITEDRSPGVRLALARQLQDAGTLDAETLRLARGSRDDDLKEFRFDDERELARAFLERAPTAVLSAAVSWNGNDGPEAYSVLLARGDLRRAQAYRDIRDGFQRLRDELIATSTESAVKSTRDQIERDLTDDELGLVRQQVEEALSGWVGPELGPWLTRRFRGAALVGLATTARKTDLPIAREFAESEHDDIRAAVLSIFERVGTRQDADRLVGIARASYGGLRERALKKAVELTPAGRRIELLLACIADGISPVWCVQHLPETRRGLDAAIRLVESEDAAVRSAAADRLLDMIDRDRWPRVVAVYMTGWHYYNVLVVFDRRLYPLPWEEPTRPVS